MEVRGVKEALEATSNLQGKKLASTTASVMGSGARTVVAPEIARATPNKYGGHRTTKGMLSNMRKITSRRVKPRPGELVAISIKPRVWFFHMVVGGTQPHIISAVLPDGARASRGIVKMLNRGPSGYKSPTDKARALFFSGVFRAEVRHPGAKPNDYISRVMAIGGIHARILKGIEDALAKKVK